MSVTAEELVRRTEEIVPELRSRADATALDRRVPVENIEAMRRAGSLKTIQATRNGGFALGIRAHLDVISALGRGCGNTAWVAGVVQAHSWLLSHFPQEAQDEIYGTNGGDTVVAAVIAPRGKAVKTDDGYRLTGVWPFGSGCERSEWLLLGAVVTNEAGEVIDEGDFAVPADQVTITDDWHTVGLTGTGSCTMSVNDIAVPAHRFLSFPALFTGSTPGGGLHGDDAVQRSAAVPVLTIALCGGSIGVAKQALADFPPLVLGKTTAYTADRTDLNPITHLRLAEAASLIREGELLLYSVADEVDAAVAAGTEVEFLDRARMRLDCAVAVRRLLEGVEILFKESGATGIRTSSPLARAVADLRAVNNHGLMKLETNLEMYGRLLLGQAPNTPLI